MILIGKSVLAERKLWKVISHLSVCGVWCVNNAEGILQYYNIYFIKTYKNILLKVCIRVVLKVIPFFSLTLNFTIESGQNIKRISFKNLWNRMFLCWCFWYDLDVYMTIYEGCTSTIVSNITHTQIYTFSIVFTQHIALLLLLLWPLLLVYSI